MIQHHHEMAQRARTDGERSTAMMREERLLRTLMSYKVSGARWLR